MADTRIGEALDLLRECGWTKRAIGHGPNGERCIMSALGVETAEVHGPRTQAFFEALYADRAAIEDVIIEQFGTFPTDTLVPNWNDHPDTAFADVERVMQKAEAKRLEEI